MRLKDIRKEGEAGPDARKLAEEMTAGFTEAVDDDLNISRGLGAFFEFLHGVNTMINEERLTRADADMIMETLKKIDSVLGVIFHDQPAKADIDASWVESMIADRIQAKKDRNFTRADEIRAELTEKGIILEDTKEGTRWKIKSRYSAAIPSLNIFGHLSRRRTPNCTWRPPPTAGSLTRS